MEKPPGPKGVFTGDGMTRGSAASLMDDVL